MDDLRLAVIGLHDPAMSEMLRTARNAMLYATAAETLPVDLARLTLLDRRGRTDVVGHILLLAGWKRADIEGLVAPEFLWKADGETPTRLAVTRLGLARPGVIVVDELLRVSDLGSWHDLRKTLYRLSTMPLDAEFRVRTITDDEE